MNVMTIGLQASAVPSKLVAKVKTYLRERSEEGAAVPAMGILLSPAEVAALDQAEIVAALDLAAINAALRHNRYQDLLAPACLGPIVAAARRIGLAPVTRPRPTLADLQRSLRSCVDVDRLEEALAFVRMMTCAESGSPIAIVFTRQLRQVMPGLLARANSAVLPTAMQELFELAFAIEAEAALPADFASALAALMDKKGWTRLRAARIAGVSVATIGQWLRGSEPRTHQRAICAAIEQALGVQPGTLLDRMSTTAVRMDSCSVLTQEVRDELDAHSIPIRALGDDWNAIGVAEKRERLKVLRDLTLTGNPFRQYAQTDHLEELPPFCNPAFTAEFEALQRFKEAEETDLFDDEPEEVVSTGRGRHFKNGGYWRKSTSALQYQNAVRLLRCLRAGLAPEQQAQLDTQRLGVLTHAGALKEMIKALARRRYNRLVRCGFFATLKLAPPKDGMVFTHGDVSRLIVIAGYLNASTGYLYKNRPELMPLDGLIDQTWLDKANEDWPATARKERAEIVSAARKIARRVQQLRDPWLPIEPLLALDQPLVPIYRALKRMAADRPPFSGSPDAMARHDRDHCLLRLWVHSKLRRSCLVQLTYRPDNTGMLRWQADGGARLVIPQALFKNAGSSALPRNGQPVEIVIEPEEKPLLRALRRWVVGDGNSRAILCRDPANDFLFPGEGDGALNSASVHRICMAFSTLYLVDLPWRPGGIPGVLPFGAHAMRDLACTHVIKQTNAPEEAAIAIFDTVDTILKAYARFTSAEKSRRSAALIRNTLPADLRE